MTTRTKLPISKKLKAYQIIVYVAKTKGNNVLSVFADDDELAEYLEGNPEYVKDIEWIRPVVTNVTAPGVDDE